MLRHAPETLNVEIIDYSRRNQPDTKQAAPPARRSGKFVQVLHGETEYFVFSSREISPYHADILERFCRERSIEGVYEEGGKRFRILDAEWIIVGGGKFEIDENERYIRLYDNSMAYGRFDDKGLRDKIRHNGMLENFEVLIG